MSNELLLIMMVHVFWTATLYTLLTIMRAPKIWGLGIKTDGTNPYQINLSGHYFSMQSVLPF